MSGVFSKVFKAHHQSACVVGMIAGLALAVPAGSADWSSSFLTRSFAQHRDGAFSDPAAPSLPTTANNGSSLQASFDHDYGDLVFGGSFLQGHSALDFGAVAQDATQQVRLRAGYDFGRTLGYVTIGEIQHGTGAHDARSQEFGIGLRVSVNRALLLAGEFVHQVSDAAMAGQQSDGEVLSLRAAFRF